MRDLINRLIECEESFVGDFESLVINGNNRGCVDGKIIGTGRSDYTQDITMYDLSINNKPFSLIDVPGIEGDESKYEEIIASSIDKAHLVFYVNGSGKKIEKGTLEKIKKYMHDGTSVYSVFNVHCKPKKERIPDIDGTYSDELNKAYLHCQEIIDQTEEELRSFLGSNYKGSVSLNGLLAFCSLAQNNNGFSSIIYDRDKMLRADQKKYLKEYDNNKVTMLRDSHIYDVKAIIENRIYDFDSYIYSENIKKLKNRLSEMIDKISELEKIEHEKINGFFDVYNEFISNCFDAKEDYIHSIRQIGYRAATDAFIEVKNDLFNRIEYDKGKTKPKEIQNYFNNRQGEILENLMNSLNQRMELYANSYEERINDAVDRMVKDFDRGQIKFSISLSTENLSINDEFGKALNYNIKAFGGDLLRVASLAFSGFTVGTAIPGLGNIVGAVIGALVGVVLRQSRTNP